MSGCCALCLQKFINYESSQAKTKAQAESQREAETAALEGGEAGTAL
jgi:hypothetical protein